MQAALANFHPGRVRSGDPRTRMRPESIEQPFVARGDFGDQVVHQCFIVQRSDMHIAFAQAHGAGIGGLAFELDHAFLARIRVDAGKAHGEGGVKLRAYPAQPVEQRLTRRKRHLERLGARRRAGGAALDMQAGGPGRHGVLAAACAAGTRSRLSLPSCQLRI